MTMSRGSGENAQLAAVEGALMATVYGDAGGAGAAAAEAVGEGHGELPMDVDEEREAGLMAREDGWKSRRRGRVEIGMVAPAIPGQTRAVPGSRFVTAGVS